MTLSFPQAWCGGLVLWEKGSAVSNFAGLSMKRTASPNWDFANLSFRKMFFVLLKFIFPWKQILFEKSKETFCHKRTFLSKKVHQTNRLDGEYLIILNYTENGRSIAWERSISSSADIWNETNRRIVVKWQQYCYYLSSKLIYAKVDEVSHIHPSYCFRQWLQTLLLCIVFQLMFSKL